MTTAPAARESGASEPAVMLFGPGHGENPFPLYARMRQAAPAIQVRTPLWESPWIVTRYGEVVDVLKDERFTVDERRVGVPRTLPLRVATGVLGLKGEAMLSVDDPEHARLRNLVQKAFTPRAIEKLEGQMTAIAHRLLDEASRKGEIDLIKDFALPLPLTVICEILGVPDAERSKFATSVARLFTSSMTLGNMLQAATSGIQLRYYFGKLIAGKRRNPDDRLISDLIAAEERGDKLSESELVMTVLLLLFAGHETTVNLIGNGTLALFDNPDQLELLRGRPELAPRAVEELLRFSPPVEFGVPRYTRQSVQLGDVRIPAGETVIALLSSAARDEAVFADPDRLDITREKNRQITFGIGSHVCLGAPLARMEAAIAFRALVERFASIGLAIPRERVEWWNMGPLRGVRKLPVRLH